jgi:hypothetical protein
MTYVATGGVGLFLGLFLQVQVVVVLYSSNVDSLKRC